MPRWSTERGTQIIEVDCLVQTHFRKMLRNVLSFELSSGGLSDAYAVSIDAVLASLAEAVDCGVEVPEDGVAMAR